MKSFYISQPGCSVSLKQEQLLVKCPRVKPEDNIRFYPISAHTVGTIEVWGSGPTLTEIPGSFIV